MFSSYTYGKQGRYGLDRINLMFTDLVVTKLHLNDGKRQEKYIMVGATSGYCLLFDIKCIGHLPIFIG